MFEIQSSDLSRSNGHAMNNAMNNMPWQLTVCRDKITARREALAREWPYLRSRISPSLVAEFIPRNQTELPEDLCPWAPGIVIAGADLLCAARVQTPDPEDWALTNFDVFRKHVPRNTLTVRRCGGFCTVERAGDYALALKYGPLPIFTRHGLEAMQLAEYCHLPPTRDEPYGARPRGAAAALCWAVCTPDGFRYQY